MSNQMIPEAAVEAAWIELYESKFIGGVGKADMRRALEAAAPHMRREATALRDWEACPKRHAGQVEHLLDCGTAE